MKARSYENQKTIQTTPAQRQQYELLELWGYGGVTDVTRAAVELYFVTKLDEQERLAKLIEQQKEKERPLT